MHVAFSHFWLIFKIILLLFDVERLYKRLESVNLFVPKQAPVKKDKGAKIGLFKFNFSCDWQLVCYKLESLLTGL